MIWLIFWFIFYAVPAKQKRLKKAEFDYIHSDSDEIVSENQEAVKWVKLLGFKQTWAFIAGKFMADPIWWFLLFWLPSFLKSEYNMTGMQVSLPLAVAYTMTCFGSIGGGWLSGYLIKKGWPVYRARKTSMLAFAFCVVPVVAAQALGTIDPWIAVFVIGLAASAHQVWSANMYTISSDMFPKKAVASVVGIGSMAGAIGGLLIARLAGVLLDHFKSLGQIETAYYIMFIISGMAYITAWMIIHLLAPKMERVDN